MSDMNLEGQRFNQLFIEKIQTADGLTKVANAMNSFIRMKVRELGIARRVINPTYVTKEDLKPRTDSDTLEYIADKEVDSDALTASFAGTVEYHKIKGQRVAIPLYRIASQKFKIAEEELLAYGYPVTKVVEENSLKDIYKREDEKLVTLADAATASTGNQNLALGAGMTKAKLMSVMKMMIQDEESGSPIMVLMHEAAWADMVATDATAIGDDLAKENLINGYPYTTVFGKRLVLTRKTSVIAEDTFYCFGAEEWLGYFLLLGDVKFFIKTEHGDIEFGTRETVGMSLVNVHSVAKGKLA